ncbi:hypothetical protein TL16_g05766 [Triparma laevis f. inornata]|uniref:Major facilitator superfamily (MFS) profile domain-containing protein n=1 Tax=Triparma laevis f. inornata TaxID=1714386 RepID=A0A9W7AQ36_9STRA|nr:hypothetical protein TL16_g05766 [Triparma laevis f. inornata]
MIVKPFIPKRTTTSTSSPTDLARRETHKLEMSSSYSSTATTKPSFARGATCVLGGCFAHLILGTMYCWGNFLSYAPTSLRFWDGLPHPGITPDAIQILPAALIALNIGMPIGAKLNKKLGPRITTLIGCILMVLGTYLASYQTRLMPFMMFYSVLSGLGVGMGYSTPMIAGWSWFPERKGLINGLTLFGFGFGAFIFNKVGTGLAQSGMAWGLMIRKISYMYAAVSFFGSMLIKANPPVEECEVNEDLAVATRAGDEEFCEVPSATFKQAITSKRFAILWLIGLMAFTPGLTILGIYKRFGMANPAAAIANDGLLSTIGGLGAITSGLGRIFWGDIVDRVGFQKGYNAQTILQLLFMVMLPFTTYSPALFGTAICAALSCYGGSIAMYVTCSAQTFGVKNAGEIYSVLFSALALASVVGAKLVIGLWGRLAGGRFSES